jgi:hypothetical protein
LKILCGKNYRDVPYTILQPFKGSKVQGSAPPLTTEVASLIKKVTLGSAGISVNKWNAHLSDEFMKEKTR